MSHFEGMLSASDESRFRLLEAHRVDWSAVSVARGSSSVQIRRLGTPRGHQRWPRIVPDTFVRALACFDLRAK